MNLHEFQTKLILRKYGIPVPEFSIISELSEIREVVEKKNLEQAVLKIQVHAGGRGKGGGGQTREKKSRDF